MLKYFIGFFLTFGSIVNAETLKATITFPNKEEKIFKYRSKEGMQIMDLKSEASRCSVDFKNSDGVPFFEVMCTPIAKGEQLKDRTRFYSTRIACNKSWPSVFILWESGGKPNENKEGSGHSLILECE